MIHELSGRNALLTGATGGLGRHMARALAAEGANLVVSGRHVEALGELSRELRSFDVLVHSVPADLSEAGATDGLAAAARAALGPIHILVNNAGTAIAAAFTLLTPAELGHVIHVDLVAPVLLTRALLPEMLERGEGHVVNVSSFAGKGALPYGVPYAAAKWGLIGVTQSLRAEYAQTPVGFSVVIPGYVAEEGIFARYQARGLKAPSLFGTTTPQRVARAVIEAVRRDLPEVLVTPRPVRPALALAALAPRTAERLAAPLGLFEYPREAARLEGRLAVGSEAPREAPEPNRDAGKRRHPAT